MQTSRINNSENADSSKLCDNIVLWNMSVYNYYMLSTTFNRL